MPEGSSYGKKKSIPDSNVQKFIGNVQPRGKSTLSFISGDPLMRQATGFVCVLGEDAW